MKITASLEEGSLSILLIAETEAEQRMVGAVIQQPQSESSACLDKSLMSATLRYEGHFTNQRVKSLKLSVYKPNDKTESA